MLAITKYERQIVVFFVFVTFLGFSVLYYRKSCFTPLENHANETGAKFNHAADKSYVEMNEDLAAVDEKILFSRRVDINSCNIEELIKLPGIGSNLAGKIIAYRKQNGNFKKIEDVLNVAGIGHSKLEKIRDFVEINQQ